VNLSDDPACNEIVELVTEFVEDAMPAADRARFERHLGDCGPCALYVTQIRRTIELTGRAAPEPLTGEAREAFLKLLRSWKSGNR
jgi:anti-sigma factor RsiW